MIEPLECSLEAFAGELNRHDHENVKRCGDDKAWQNSVFRRDPHCYPTMLHLAQAILKVRREWH